MTRTAIEKNRVTYAALALVLAAGLTDGLGAALLARCSRNGSLEPPAPGSRSAMNDEAVRHAAVDPGFETVEIDTAGCCICSQFLAIPTHVYLTCRNDFVQQCIHQLYIAVGTSDASGPSGRMVMDDLAIDYLEITAVHTYSAGAPFIHPGTFVMLNNTIG